MNSKAYTFERKHLLTRNTQKSMQCNAFSGDPEQHLLVEISQQKTCVCNIFNKLHFKICSTICQLRKFEIQYN